MQKKEKRNRILIFVAVLGFSIITILFFLSANVIAEAGDQETQRQIHIFLESFDFIRNAYVDESKVTPKILIEGALKGMLEALEDPPSVYLTESDMKDMEETTVGTFGGVGLYIYDVEQGIEVSRPIAGTPAYKAGISAGDIIIAVDDESVLELDIDAVIERLKGVPGTDVKITILRGKTKTLDFTLSRAIIEIPTIRRDMIEEIGYLKINQFTPLTYDHVKESLEFFRKHDYKSLVIDLRSNPGGLLPSVIDVADLFFPFGKLIVYTSSRIESENQKYRARGAQVVPQEIPITILIDRYSASASEILTGVMKDYNRATIIGEKSYGKGSVQQIRHTGDGGGIKLTTSRYYTPSGVTIDKVGIEPDIKIQEEEWTDAEREELSKLYESKAILDFVEANQELTAKKIDQFIESLRKEGILLQDRYLRRLIRNEMNHTNNNPPVYDLEFDLVLKEAVKVLRAK